MSCCNPTRTPENFDPPQSDRPTCVCVWTRFEIHCQGHASCCLSLCLPSLAMTMSLLPMRSSADAVHVDAPQSDLRATPSSVGQELKTLISNELQPFSDTGITREMLRNSFQAKRPPKAVLKNDFVWVRILNQSRIFVKHSETSKDPLVPHYRHNGFLQGLRRIVKSLPDVEFVAAMNDEPPCDMEVSMHAPIMTWSKRHSPPCNNIRLPCWSIMQDEYYVKG